MLLVRLGFSHYRQSIDSNGFNFYCILLLISSLCICHDILHASESTTPITLAYIGS